MNVVNLALTRLFDLVFAPLASVPPFVSLAILSLLVAMGMLWVFKRTSNQTAIAAAKDRITAGVFEIRLFNDDLVQIFRAQGGILRHNLTYFGLSLVPLAWMILPFVLLMAQLQFRYGFDGFHVGDEPLLTVELKPDWRADLPQVDEGARPPAELETPAGVTSETPAVWLPAKNELAWRLAPEREGSYEVAVKVGDQTYTKTLEVADGGVAKRSPLRHDGSILDALLYPMEPSLPDGPVKAIRLTYPDATVWFLGWHWHWLIVFFVLSVVFAFALKDRFGVTI
ncbi:MAG: hypothetical protein R3B81_06275 [bacterium]